jgi:hypothetical protein
LPDIRRVLWAHPASRQSLREKESAARIDKLDLEKVSAAEESNLDRFIAEFRRIALLPPASVDAGLMPRIHPLTSSPAG